MAADRSRTRASGILRAVFVGALAMAIGAQLALMSVLDDERADAAARAVAESDFAADLVEDAVREAVAPTVGDEPAAEIARRASTDPRVAEVLRLGLLDAHRSVVDPDAVTETGTDEVRAVLDQLIDQLVGEAEAQTGLELDAVRPQLAVPTLDPRFAPDAGVRPIAELVRGIGALVALVAAVLAIVVHPRPGRALSGLGTGAAIVCGGWLLALLVLGWSAGLVDGTLFGRLVRSMWTASSPAMLLLAGAGAALGAGLWFGGIAVDGFTRQRRPGR
jgi:hypothetical protein